jgi:hypothetical protein
VQSLLLVVLSKEAALWKRRERRGAWSSCLVYKEEWSD